MSAPAVSGALNVSALAGNEIVPLATLGPRDAQTTTQDIADLAVGQLTWEQLPYEMGPIVDARYYYGDAPRYGILPNTGINYVDTGQWDILMINSCLPGIEGRVRRGHYSHGFSTRATLSNMNIYFEPGITFGNIIHMISRPNGAVPAAATVIMSAGALGTITLTQPGTYYFLAPRIEAVSNGGGNILSGAILAAVMEASAVDTIVSAGKGYVAAEQITSSNGVVITVDTVDANGGVATCHISTRSTMADPTANLYGNLYIQSSTTGTGSGAAFLLSFRISSITKTASGSGGTATGSIKIENERIQRAAFYGHLATYGKLGVQDTVDCVLCDVDNLNNPALNTDSLGGGGGHFDSNDNLKAGVLTCYGTQQVMGDNYGWAGYSFDTSSAFPNRKTTYERIYVKTAAAFGIAQNAELQGGEMRVDACGTDATIVSTPYFGPAGLGACAYYCYRGFGYATRLKLMQNEQTIGASFEYSGLIASTGFGGANNSSDAGSAFVPPDNNLQALNSPSIFPMVFGSIDASQICRKGFSIVDRNHDETGAPAHVVAGAITLEISASIAMTSGYQMFHVNPNKATSVISRSLFRSESLLFINPTAADGFFSDITTDIEVGSMDFPRHGGGKLAVINGRAKFWMKADQTNNLGLPLSGSNALLTINGTDTAGSEIDLYADSGANNSVQPVVVVNNTTDVTLGWFANHYRNADLVTLSGGNTRLKVKKAVVISISASGNGIVFNGAFTDCSFADGYVTACAIGLKTTAPTFTRCMAINFNVDPNPTNTTPTQILNGAFGGLLNTTNFTL